MNNEPKNITDIPQSSSYQENSKNFNSSKFQYKCACCGKGLNEPKFFINTIWGGSMYPANDNNQYNDSWQMPIGNDCIKRIPTEYIIQSN